MAQIEKLRPFPDVVEALTILKKKFNIAILSNGDRDMLENLGIEFGKVISVEEAGYLKPHFASYRAAAEVLKTEPSEIMHVADHPFDYVGAKAFGMRAA